jgi:hypothetical protein
VIKFDLNGRDVDWAFAGRITGSLAVGEGIVAVPEYNKLTFLDAGSGQRLWDWQGDSQMLGNVVLTETHALVSTMTATHAIDLSTHESVWSTPTAGVLALTDDVLVISNRAGVYAYSVPEPGMLAVPAAVLALMVRRRR